MTSLKLLSSESVTEGHPDKLCDCISDAILDECLSRDPGARVAVEVFVKGFDSDNENDGKSFIVIGGEITLKNSVNIDYEKINLFYFFCNDKFLSNVSKKIFSSLISKASQV